MRKKLSIYIHIPFCVKKCVYCDFLSFGADDPQINRSGAVRKAYVQSICILCHRYLKQAKCC